MIHISRYRTETSFIMLFTFYYTINIKLISSAINDTEKEISHMGTYILYTQFLPHYSMHGKTPIHVFSDIFHPPLRSNIQSVPDRLMTVST